MNHESLIRDVANLRQVIIAVEDRNKMLDRQDSNHSIHNSDRFEEGYNLALIVDNFEAIKCVIERIEKISTFNKKIEYILPIGAGIVTITLCLRFLFC